MESIHEMLVQDEIFLCGIVLLFGVIIGAAARLVYALLKRRSA